MDKDISVLIVEDDTNICFLIELVFKGFKIPSLSVGSLKMAKDELEVHIPTFIFLDNSLPDGKGVDFIKFIIVNYPCVKIIMCTAENLESLINEKEIYQYIQKPFAIERLTNVIQELIKLPECSKEEKCFNQNCSWLKHI